MVEQGIIDTKTGLTIHPERDERLTDFSKNLLQNFYLKENETIQEGFARASFAWSNGDNELAQRLYDYVSKGACMFASPVLSNAPEVETLNPLKFKKNKGLPISCYLTYVDDSIEGLIAHTAEERWLSVLGGGVGAAWGSVRSVSNKSPGPIPFLHTVDADMEAYRQGFTRRGSYAAYLDISHPDIIEFLNIRVPTGDISRKCHSSGFHNAINISDDFMIALLSDKDWDLVDPASGEVKETVSARELWDQILDVRYRTGEPYLCFIDEANRNLPQAQKDKGLYVRGSNLCLTGDTIINVKIDNEYENITLEDFCNNFKNYNNPLVKSYNIDKNIIEYKSVTAAALTGYETDLMQISKKNSSIICTKDHKVFTTTNGYKEAENITLDDTIMISDGDMVLPTTPDIVKQVTFVTNTKTENTPVYDITVEDNHNFFANNILVHNCSEILLPTSSERTAVCCLSSLNLETYDEWKDTNIVQDLILMLDNVLQYFIDNAQEPLKKAAFSASQERSLGLGVMGFHYMLQKNKIPFESISARKINKEVFEFIKTESVKMSEKLAEIYGECPDLQTDLDITFKDGSSIKINSSELVKINGEEKRVFNIKKNDKLDVGLGEFEVTNIEGLHSHSGRRNAHLLAPAPTANSGIIMGTSPSIEPANANAYTHQTRAGSWAVKNSHLEKLLEEKGLNTQEVWSEIINSKGSIQHMDIFTEEEKKLFKTAIEINQNWVIQHAADRQPFICQSQSVNLFLPPKCSRDFMSNLHINAWKKKVKTLYYVRTTTPHRAENVSLKVESNKLQDDGSSCVACEG